MMRTNKHESTSISTSLIKLFAGQGISIIGNSFTGIALLWFIVQTGSAMQVGIKLALGFIPNIFLAPFVGSIVDRSSRKFLLWFSDALRLLLDIVLIIFINFGWFNIGVIYVYTLLQAIVRLFYVPAQRAVIQQLTSKEQRVKANAMQDLFMRIGMVLGPMLAGLAVRSFSKQFVIAFDALTFLISLVIILSVHIDEKHVTKVKKNDYFRQLKDGLNFVGKHSWIVLFSTAYAFINGGNSVSVVSRPFLIKDVLGLGVDAVGFLASAGSFGAILVSMTLIKIKLKGHKLNYSIFSIIMWGVGLILISVVNNFTQLVIVQLIAFSMGPIMVICGNSFYQDEVPPGYMGRVFAVRSMISSLAMPIGFLFGSSIMKVCGIRGSFIISGALVLTGALFTYLAKQSHGKKTQVATVELSDK